MCDRIDAECTLNANGDSFDRSRQLSFILFANASGTDVMCHSEPEACGEAQPTQPVAPKETGYYGRQDVAEQGRERKVASMLELDELIGAKVRDVGRT